MCSALSWLDTEDMFLWGGMGTKLSFVTHQSRGAAWLNFFLVLGFCSHRWGYISISKGQNVVASDIYESSWLTRPVWIAVWNSSIWIGRSSPSPDTWTNTSSNHFNSFLFLLWLHACVCPASPYHIQVWHSTTWLFFLSQYRRVCNLFSGCIDVFGNTDPLKLLILHTSTIIQSLIPTLRDDPFLPSVLVSW